MTVSPKGPKIETAAERYALATEVTARERAVRDRAEQLAAKRTAPVDPVVDWLEAERSIYRRAAVRMTLEGERYRVEVELPGVAKNDVTIRVGDGRLVIRAERSTAAGVALIDEFGVCEIWREVTLAPDAVLDSVTAALADGVLTLTLARKPAPADAEIDDDGKPAPSVAKRAAKRAPSRKGKRPPAK
jgi:HSP20 family protein